MQIIIIIFLSILLVIAVFMIYFKIKRRNLMKRFKEPYHDFDDEDFDFESLKQIRRYWDSNREHENPAYFIDDTTWNDLDMDHLFFKMNATQSSVGEEYFYAKLRSVNFDKDELERFGDKIDFMDENSSVKTNSIISLYYLGKNLYNGTYEFIFDIKRFFLQNMIIYYILMMFPIISAVLCFFTPLGFVMVFLSYITNTIFYQMHKFKFTVNLHSISYIQKIFICASELSNMDFGNLDFNERLKNSLKPLRKITIFMNNALHVAANELESLFEFLKTLLMLDFINYDRITKLLLKHSKEFHEVFKAVGEIDTVIAISEYRKTLSFYSKPNFKDMPEAIFENLYHRRWCKNRLLHR